MNLLRRHMSESQRASAAARLANLKPGRPAVNTAISVVSPTQAEAARMMNVSVDSLQRARKVQETAPAEIIRAVNPAVFARLGGPPAALEAIAAEILARFPGTVLAGDAADEFWRGMAAFRWAHADGGLAKFALTPVQMPEFSAWVRTQPGARGESSG